MKLIIICILILTSFLFLQSCQDPYNQVFDIKYNKSEKSVELQQRVPIKLKNDSSQNLTISLYRNIYTKEKEKSFTKGYIFIAVTLDIASVKFEDVSVEINFENGTIIEPYSSYDEEDDELFFSIENNIYKQVSGNAGDEFVRYLKNRIIQISVINNGKKYDFDVPENTGKLLMQYIELIGKYKYGKK